MSHAAGQLFATNSQNADWETNVAPVLALYGLHPDSELKLLSLSENATYSVTSPDKGSCAVLRLHRPGYRLDREILSEIAWTSALRRDGVASTPAVKRTLHNDELCRFPNAFGLEQHAVVFDFVEGRHPSEEDSVGLFSLLGETAAALHDHSRKWKVPEGFTRPNWDVETSIGENGHWGCWKHNPDVSAAQFVVMSLVDQKIRTDLLRYGNLAHRCGLIHGDMRLANLMVNEGGIHIIDFDDCGFSWHLYELACSLSFIEALPDVDDRVARWVEAYSRHAPLSKDDLAAIPALIMMRRLLLVGWFATHGFAKEARELSKTYVPETMGIAELYLSGRYARV